MKGRIKKKMGLPDGSDFEHFISRSAIRNAGVYVNVLRMLEYCFLYGLFNDNVSR
jgi:hypothetical protein